MSGKLELNTADPFQLAWHDGMIKREKEKRLVQADYGDGVEGQGGRGEVAGGAGRNEIGGWEDTTLGCQCWETDLHATKPQLRNAVVTLNV